MKDAGLRIRVQRELRQSFQEACKAEDKSAAQVLREFMRQYVQNHNTLSEVRHKENTSREKREQ
ncbi:hypothetical protein [Rhodosalinus sp. 5P4]|uniref:hypothetical protein n=1 Tax=Rhodosalinus sp. 5P4 TaxID=3239196 RepID=UPI003523E928